MVMALGEFMDGEDLGSIYDQRDLLII